MTVLVDKLVVDVVDLATLNPNVEEEVVVLLLDVVSVEELVNVGEVLLVDVVIVVVELDILYAHGPSQ